MKFLCLLSTVSSAKKRVLQSNIRLNLSNHLEKIDMMARSYENKKLNALILERPFVRCHFPLWLVMKYKGTPFDCDLKTKLQNCDLPVQAAMEGEGGSWWLPFE